MRYAQTIVFLFGVFLFATAGNAWNKHGTLNTNCNNAPAITIVPSYDSSFTSDPQYATLNSAVQAVVAELEATVFVNTTVNVYYYAGSTANTQCGGGLSCSDPDPCTTNPTYAQYVSALTANAKTTTAQSAVASLPASDPHSGFTWYPSRAACKALGLQASDGSNDGEAFINSHSYNFFYPPSSPTSGKYDAYGVVFHETTEAMGRQIYNGGANVYAILDEYQFSAANTRATPNATRYYSTNNGVTALSNFNTSPTEDPMDWSGAQGADSFNVNVSANTTLPYSLTDQKVIDTLGYSAACGSSY